MNRVIYKYDLTTNDIYTKMALPKGAQVLHFDWQHQTPRIWALVDPDAPLVPRIFAQIGTGQPEFDDATWDYQHIGTAMVSGGSYVFHLFEVTPKAEFMAPDPEAAV